MEHSMTQAISSNKDKVILYLMGIDKKWTRGRNNQWVEYREEDQQKEIKIEMYEEVISSKKWWQFWKKE